MQQSNPNISNLTRLIARSWNGDFRNGLKVERPGPIRSDSLLISHCALFINSTTSIGPSSVRKKERLHLESRGGFESFNNRGQFFGSKLSFEGFRPPNSLTLKKFLSLEDFYHRVHLRLRFPAESPSQNQNVGVFFNL